MNPERVQIRDKRIRDLIVHRKGMLESLKKDLEYALKGEDIEFAAPNTTIWVRLIQVEKELKVLLREEEEEKRDKS